jgi:hypothetical protein
MTGCKLDTESTRQEKGKIAQTGYIFQPPRNIDRELSVMKKAKG